MRDAGKLKADGERFRFLTWNRCAVGGDGRYVMLEWWHDDDHIVARGHTLREAVDNAILYGIPDSSPPEDL